MSDYVIMPKADYVAACDAIRAKTGKTDLIKSGDMESEILGITSGGGSSEDVRYVTFMNDDGTVELGKKAVAAGDDCADPIARGVFDTPTKESTVQYNYTFSGGWATTPGGGIDSNALKAVNEDRTVYANFISAVRYYTITFYDDDGTTVLNTLSIPYGSTPVYTPDKESFSFIGWTPALTVVTGNASYTAQWKALTGLRFVSKATGVETGLGGTALNSMLEVTNSGKKVVAAFFNKAYKDIPVYSMTTPEATTEYIQTPAERWIQYAVLNNTDDKILSYVPNGTKLESIGFDGTVTSQSIGQIAATSFSPSSNTLFYRTRAGSNDYRIRKVTPGINDITDICQLGSWQPYYIKVTKNDEYIVCANSDDGVIRIYRIADGTLMQTISTGKTYAMNNLSVSADGKRFSIGWSVAPYVSVYSLETMEQICDLSNIITDSSRAAFVGDILIVSTGTTVRAFTIVDGVPEEYFDIPTYSGGNVTRIATSLNGNHIVFYDGNNIELWSKV